MYPWIVFLHVAATFGFVRHMAHGASAAAFALRRERNLERVRALLTLPTNTFNVMYLSPLVLRVSSITAGVTSRCGAAVGFGHRSERCWRS